VKYFDSGLNHEKLSKNRKQFGIRTFDRIVSKVALANRWVKHYFKSNLKSSS